MSSPIQIDGSYGEGGGQVVRTSLSLSAITGREIEIFNVRANRSRPGFQPQHLMAVEAAARICDAKYAGNKKGSVYLKFSPQRPVQAGDYELDIGTAGSTSLVAQTVLMPLILAGGESSVTIRGGTHNDHAPCADYLECVYLEVLRRAGVEASMRVDRAGFYPMGGGLIYLQVRSEGRLRGLELLRRGARISAEARVIVTNKLEQEILDRGVRLMTSGVGKVENIPVVGSRPESPGPGAASFIGVTHEQGLGGFSGLGARGKPIEEVVREAGTAMSAWVGSDKGVDEHLADQLVLPMALAQGSSRWSTSLVSEHLRTVIWVVRQFLPRQITLTENEDGSGQVTIE